MANLTYNINEFVELTGIKKTTLMRLLRQGKAPGRKIGGEWRILKEDAPDFAKKYLRGEIN